MHPTAGTWLNTHAATMTMSISRATAPRISAQHLQLILFLDVCCRSLNIQTRHIHRVRMVGHLGACQVSCPAHAAQSVVAAAAQAAAAAAAGATSSSSMRLWRSHQPSSSFPSCLWALHPMQALAAADSQLLCVVFLVYARVCWQWWRA